MRTNVIEALIGAIVLVVAGVFLAFAYSSSDVGRVSGYEVTAAFSQISGLSVGSDVRVSGIKVGSVVRQSLDENSYQALVHMNIDPTVELPEDSSAKITADGLLGSNYVLIEPGGSPDILERGGRIQFTQGSVDLMSLLGQAVFQMGAGNEEQ